MTEDPTGEPTPVLRPSFERDIVPLFRAEDRFAMSGFFDLMSYEDVRASATLIYERVNDRTMPCDQPWSTAEIAVFSNWLETGCAP